MADLRRTDNHNVQYLQWLYLCVCLLYGIASVNRWLKQQQEIEEDELLHEYRLGGGGESERILSAIECRGI